MSLNYDLSKIDNFAKLAKTQPGMVQTMCFATMFVGCPVIAESGKDSWRTVFKRIRMWEAAHGNLGSRPITPADVQRFIGLWTNASRMTESQYGKHLAQGLRNRAEDALRQADEQEKSQ